MKLFNLFKKFDANKVLEKINNKNITLRFVGFLFGIFLMALSFNIFLAPNNFVTGGVSGLAILVSHATGMETSTFIFFANMFLVGLSLILLGGQKSIINIIGALAYSLLIFVTSDINDYLHILLESDLLYVLCGAILYGVGAGIVFRTGFSSGGSDILGMIISKYTKKPLGKSLLILNVVIILIGGVTFGYTMVIYAIIINYISTLLIDKILLGISDSKMFYIYTEKEEEIKEFIFNIIKSGVTVINAKGGYNKEKKTILMCIVSTQQYYALKEAIQEIDNNSFIVVNDCYEVYGGTKRNIIPF